MKETIIRIRDLDGDFADELVILKTPKEVTEEIIEENLRKASNLLYEHEDILDAEDFSEYSKEDCEIMEEVYDGRNKGTILDYIEQKYGWRYKYIIADIHFEY